MTFVVVLALLVSLLPVVGSGRARAAEVPAAAPGAGPVERGVPAGASPNEALPAGRRYPVVPPSARPGGRPVALSASAWSAVRRPAARVAAAEQVFTDVALRSGYLLGDTSLVALFNADTSDPAWTSWRVRLYEEGGRTEQASLILPREELERSRCSGTRSYCRSLGSVDGWTLDPARRYFVTVAAVYPDREVVSAESGAARPRRTIVPPAVPVGQAAGCGCGNALALTAGGQAHRALGVNTATGAFARVEPDLSMASFGVPFASARTYSSANAAGGPFGPGWAWSYDMRVTASEDGAVVRVEDGAEAFYRLGEAGYVRPPGVRSTLHRAGAGWELRTPRQISYAFDGQGRLTAVLTARGVGVRLSYEGLGVHITDASGRRVVVRIEDGLIRQISLPDGRHVSYGYDGTRLVWVLDPRGFRWSYRYGAGGQLTQVVNPHGVVEIDNTYDPVTGRVTAQRDGLGMQTRFEWDAGAQEARTVDADGVLVRDGYRGNVLVYSQRGERETDQHRYDAGLNRNLVVNGNQHQHEATHDGNGNRTSATAPAPLGLSERTTYDSRNNPTEHVDGRGNVWKDSYNEFNELVRSVDAEGHRITHAYDARGLRVSTTDPRGKVTRFEYLPAGNENSGLLRAVVSPEGRRTEVGHDRTGRRTSVTDPRGTVAGANRAAYTTTFAFDAADHQTAVLQPGKPAAWRTGFDEVGRVVRRQTPTGATTNYAYFANGLLQSVDDSRRTTSFTYTDAGRRASARQHLRQGPHLVTTYRYNHKGLLFQVTSPRGNAPGANPAEFTTTYVYDANDNPVQIRRPYPGGGTVTRDIKPDELDRTVSTLDEFNKPSSFGRDNTGNVTHATDTLGRTTRMDYDRNGRQKGITDPDGNTTRVEYDEAGNKVRQTSPVGGTTTWTYDGDGLLTSVTEPRGNVAGADPARFTTRFVYDRAGNRTRAIDPLGNTTTHTYDAHNRLVASTDAKGRTTHYTYRADDLPRTVHTPDSPYSPTDPTLRSTVYDYADDGLLVSVRDPLGRYTRFDYDDAGRITATADPLARRTEVTYDAESNPTSTITVNASEWPPPQERARRTVVNTYDIAGRLTERKLGSAGPTYTYGYDAKDRLTSYGDPGGLRRIDYNDEDEVTRAVRSEPGRPDEVFGYEYDARGNVTERRYPDGTRIDARYDADSRLTELTASGGSAGAAATWRFGYDVAGRRTSTTLPAATGLIERRAYDDAGRLTGIGTTRDPAAPARAGVQDPVSAFALTLDEVGNPTRVATTRGGVSEAVAYAYDAVDRVTSACYAATSCATGSPNAGRIDYTYDLLGNRTSQRRSGTAGNDTTTYTYDAASQLTRATVTRPGSTQTTTYAYDVHGNQTAAGADRFEYHLDNSLAKATVSGRTTTFGYDGVGRRVAATTGTGSQATTRRWAWDTNGSLPQIAVDTLHNATGQVTERRAFAYGPDDEPLALLDPAQGVHAYTHDWLGGVATMLNPDGTVAEGYDYDPFGNPRTGPTLTGPAGGPTASGRQAAAPANPMRYTGAYADDSTGQGNYHLRARTYNPGTGRFTSTDPMPTGPSAISPYVYAANNPVAFTDPTGAVLDAGRIGERDGVVGGVDVRG
ncbi:MAG TPA: RHS repeat-associated core domain-containing protein, partial [Pilimelia sp.]|nr:RHS repeat-associated core domain-containing protein [Pilimelia sp.]